MEDRTYKQGIARYTPDEIVDKASKDSRPSPKIWAKIGIFSDDRRRSF